MLLVSLGGLFFTLTIFNPKFRPSPSWRWLLLLLSSLGLEPQTLLDPLRPNNLYEPVNLWVFFPFHLDKKKWGGGVKACGVSKPKKVVCQRLKRWGVKA